MRILRMQCVPKETIRVNCIVISIIGFVFIIRLNGLFDRVSHYSNLNDIWRSAIQRHSYGDFVVQLNVCVPLCLSFNVFASICPLIFENAQ